MILFALKNIISSLNANYFDKQQDIYDVGYNMQLSFHKGLRILVQNVYLPED